MCAPAGQSQALTQRRQSRITTTRWASRAPALAKNSVIAHSLLLMTLMTPPIVVSDDHDRSHHQSQDPHQQQRHIEKAIFNAYLSGQDQEHQERAAQQAPSEGYYARHAFYEAPTTPPPAELLPGFYRHSPPVGSDPLPLYPRAEPMDQQDHPDTPAGAIIDRPSDSEHYARRASRRNNDHATPDGNEAVDDNTFTLSLQEEELRRMEEMAREAATQVHSSERADTEEWDSWRRAINEGSFQRLDTARQGEESPAGAPGDGGEDYYLVPVSDTAKCFSCMSKFYEAVWPALAHVYKRPMNFTDACNEEFLDARVVPVTHCPTICVSMWEEPAVAGVRIRGHIRGCLDDLLHNGFNQSVVSWYRWMQRDSCRQYRKRELFKLSAAESDDSTINVCTCYADHCNASAAISWRLRHPYRSLMSSLLIYTLCVLLLRRVM